MSSELAAIDWFGRGWLLLLAFTAAVLLVAALRKPCRHLFGAERAFQWWLLPPLAMLSSQLPHAVAAPVTVFSTMISTVTPAALMPHTQIASAHSVDWRLLALILWLAGSAVSLLLAMRAQLRYRRRLHDARVVDGLASARPVLRAATADIGPALVGAWRSRIILPADFEQRYSDVEQVLILAHETMHARRHDGWWCLLGRIFAAVFWFHPLAWWALFALRHDQELACDAAVLHEHGAKRRSYAQAMLKTQSAAMALPVGCPWSPRHPVTERIAMLKLKQPDVTRRRTGGVVLVMIAASVVSAVYATTPAPRAPSAAAPAEHYTLTIDAVMGGGDHASHFSYCVTPNQYVMANGTGKPADKFSWQGRFAIAPVANGQLEIRAQVDTRFDRGAGNVHIQSAKPVVRTLPGISATVQFGQVVQGKDQAGREDNTIKLVLTPLPGCVAGTGVSGAVAAPDHARVGDPEYQLNLSINLGREEAGAAHDRRVNLAVCTGVGQPASVKSHAMNISTQVSPVAGGKLGIELKVADESGATLAKSRLLGRPNELLHADGPGADGHSHYSIDLTPLEGCPARTAEMTSRPATA